jgi:F-type H+-transporting ATPase subunit delta
MDPLSESLARVYAEALLGQVPGDVEAEAVAAELDAIVDLLDELDGFEELLTAALLTHADRTALVERIFRGRVAEPVEAALAVMANAGRLGLLRTLRRAFRSALYRRQGKRELTVVTAVGLSEPQRRRVVEALEQTLGGEVLVTWQVDGELLGGMVVRIGDHVYDASVRTELRHLQDRLGQEIRLEPPEAAGERIGRADGSR